MKYIIDKGTIIFFFELNVLVYNMKELNKKILCMKNNVQYQNTNNIVKF